MVRTKIPLEIIVGEAINSCEEGKTNGLLVVGDIYSDVAVSVTKMFRERIGSKFPVVVKSKELYDIDAGKGNNPIRYYTVYEAQISLADSDNPTPPASSKPLLSYQQSPQAPAG